MSNSATVRQAAQLYLKQEVAPQLANKKLLSYANNPLGFVKDFIKFPRGKELAPYQEEILGSFISNRRTAIRSPHGAGKTMLASCLTLWAVMTSEDVKVLTTASAWRQLTHFLWPEIRKWSKRLDWGKIGRSPFDKTELQMLSLKLGVTQEAFALASDNPDLIEGAHAEKVFFFYWMNAKRFPTEAGTQLRER